MAFDPWASTNQGLSNLTNTLGTLAQLKRQDQQYADEAPLRSLQMQQAQQGVEQQGLTLANLKGQQGALTDQYGTTGQPDALPRAMSFQAQEEQMQKEQATKQKGFEVYLNTIKALDGMTNLDATTKTEIGKHFLSQNPDYAPFANNLKYVDSKGVKAARQFGEGELKDPATGKPLPAGYYETEGVWTGDAANPVKLTAYKLVPEKKDEHETWGDPYQDNVGGKKAMMQKSSRGQVRSVLADNSTTVKVSAGGGHDTMQGGKPQGGKILPAGQLESIADMKRVKDVLAEASDLLKSGKIDTGPVSGRLQSLGSKVGLASDNFVNLQQKMQTAENIMLKLRSGAAVTESEYQRFKKEFPRTSDTPEVRDRKMANAIGYASTLMDSKMDIYEEGGYRVPQSVKSGGKPAGKPAQKQAQGQTKKGGRFTIIEGK